MKLNTCNSITFDVRFCSKNFTYKLLNIQHWLKMFFTCFCILWHSVKHKEIFWYSNSTQTYKYRFHDWKSYFSSNPSWNDKVHRTTIFRYFGWKLSVKHLIFSPISPLIEKMIGTMYLVLIFVLCRRSCFLLYRNSAFG